MTTPIGMDKATLERDIESIMGRAHEKIGTLAAEYREKVLLPFCREHKLTFAAGNETFCFFDEDGECVYLDGTLDELNEFEPNPEIVEVLNLTTTSNLCDFSHYMEDITEEDIQ